MKIVQSRTVESATVDFTAIPSYQTDAMCRTLISCINRLFEDPAVKADYEYWKQEQNQRKEQAQ